MEKRIFYHDTDAGGIVYYANYLKYLEEARTEFLEKRNLSVEEFRDRGLFYAVRKCSITYRSPARYGDVLLCDATLTKVTAAQLVFDQKIYHQATGQLMIESEVTLACLSKDFKPTQIPDDLREKLLAG